MTGEMAYRSDGLRAGGAQARRTAADAEQVAATLRTLDPQAAAFGVVKGAVAVAAAIGRSRDVHGDVADTVARVHADIAARAERVAATGDDLTAGTTRLAGHGVTG